MASKHRNGIGAPGRWIVDEAIAWIADPPAPTGLNDTRPPREMPVRDLLPNERIGMSLGGAVVLRTDLLAELPNQFTDADRQTLKNIERLLLESRARL